MAGLRACAHRRTTERVSDHTDGAAHARPCPPRARPCTRSLRYPGACALESGSCWPGWRHRSTRYPTSSPSSASRTIVILTYLVLRSVARAAGNETLERHWRGSPEGLGRARTSPPPRSSAPRQQRAIATQATFTTIGEGSAKTRRARWRSGTARHLAVEFISVVYLGVTLLTASKVKGCCRARDVRHWPRGRVRVLNVGRLKCRQAGRGGRGRHGFGSRSRFPVAGRLGGGCFFPGFVAHMGLAGPGHRRRRSGALRAVAADGRPVVAGSALALYRLVRARPRRALAVRELVVFRGARPGRTARNVAVRRGDRESGL